MPSPEDHGKRSQILEAAARVFARDGFARATIKHIAAEAGLSAPALIYWYFKDKYDLFQSVLMETSLVLTEIKPDAPEADSMPRETLLHLASRFIATFQQPHVGQLFRIFMAEATRDEQVSRRFEASTIQPVQSYLTSYLQHQVDLGRLRPHDCQAAARALVGSLLIYVLSHELFVSVQPELDANDPYLATVIDIFLHGLQSSDPAEGEVS
mgnify:FL=1